MSTWSVRLDHTSHTRSVRLWLCPDCRSVVICCCRRVHRGEGIERIALAGVSEVFAGGGIPLGLNRCYDRHALLPCIEHHPFRPFVVRSDAQIYSLVWRSRRMECCGDSWQPMIERKQRDEKDGSDPYEVLAYRHDKQTFATFLDLYEREDSWTTGWRLCIACCRFVICCWRPARRDRPTSVGASLSGPDPAA